VTDIFQSFQGYFNIPFCGDWDCNASIGEDSYSCPNDCVAPVNESFSFMWIGDDNSGSGSVPAIRYGYTNFPDMEIVFSIPDRGDMPNDHPKFSSEWQNNPNADPSFNPIFFGLGNHDTEVVSTVNYTVEVLGPQITASLPGMRNFQEGPYDVYPNGYEDRNLTYSFDYKNAHFVMMHAYLRDLTLDPAAMSGLCGYSSSSNRFDGKPLYGPTGCIHDDLLIWLDNDLASTNAKHIFLFTHEGAHPTPGGRHATDSLDCLYCPNNWGNPWWLNGTRPKREEFWSILAKHNVTAVFVGHGHHNTLTWVNDIHYGNGALYEIEAGHPPRLAVVNIKGDNAILRLYDGGNFEHYGPMILSRDPVNYPPDIRQHVYGVDQGFPVIYKTNYNFEVDLSSRRLYFEAYDNDTDDTLTYSFNNLPSFFAVNDPSISRMYAGTWEEQYRRLMLSTGTLTTADIGNHSFDVIVSDGQLQDSMTINFSVLPAQKPVVLGAAFENGSTVTRVDHIWFFCEDNTEVIRSRYSEMAVYLDGVQVQQTGVPIRISNGYPIDSNGWNTWFTSQISDKLAGSRFQFFDKEAAPGRYDVTFYCRDYAYHRSDTYTLTFFYQDDGIPLSQTLPWVTGIYPLNGSTVSSLDTVWIMFGTFVDHLGLLLTHTQIDVYKDGQLFNDYTISGFGYGEQKRYLTFNSPAQNGVYEFVVTPMTDPNQAGSAETKRFVLTVSGQPGPGPVCSGSQTQNCPNQQGVCSGSQETCAGGVWPGCNSATYLAHDSNYEAGTEASCSDGLDNDCDGQDDCNDGDCSSDPSCSGPGPTGIIYVDNGLSGDCSDYNPSGGCGAGSDQAYDTLAEATAAANAGDTVEIRGGTYNEILRPANSGTSGNPITFQNYGSEEVIITGTAYDPRLSTHPDDPNLNYGAIWLENNSYIVIDGLNFSNVEGFGRLTNAHNNIIRNSDFYGGGSAWIIGLNLFESHDNVFDNNIFEGTSDNFRIIHSERNIIENSRFLDARHVSLTFKCSSNNVIRNNYFNNQLQKTMEVFDCEQPTMEDHYNIDYKFLSILNDSKRNLIENNEFAYTAPDIFAGDGPYNHIQYAGQEGIIRNNVFYDSHGIAIGMTRYSTEALYNMINRVYNNVFYDNMGGGLTTTRQSPDFIDNIFVNNIFYKNYPIGIKWADGHPSGSQITHGAMANFLIDNNNIINNTPGDLDVIYDSYNHRITLAQAELTYPALYMNNIEVDPQFVDESTHDFHLQTGSQMRDAGKFLTTTVGPGTSSTSMKVADVLYFYDGFGISGEQGDLIQLDGQVTTARITNIDYATSTLTLNTALSWTDGQGVSLAYNGNAPDIGAFEY
jgi:hypothetical protein